MAAVTAGATPDDRRLPQALRADGPHGNSCSTRMALISGCRGWWDDVRRELVVEDPSVAEGVLLHERVAQALEHAAFDLPFAGRRD
jgi:hypothetical protein